MQLAVAPQADQRSAEILALVRQAFVEKGFDGASMQDLAKAAGMSVGNFYRYFPSKSAIIKAMIGADHAELQQNFDHIINSPNPMAALRATVHLHIGEDDYSNSGPKDGELWTEIEAAARRSPEIGAAAQQMHASITDALLTVFASETGLTQKEAKDRFSASAAFIMVLFKASSCLNCAQDVDQSELKSMIIRTIEQTLDDVSNSARKA